MIYFSIIRKKHCLVSFFFVYLLMFKKILKFLLILQEVSNSNRNPKLGRGFLTAYRFNPYNPLSYIALVIILVAGILMFGFVGIWKEVKLSNPFKWD